MTRAERMFQRFLQVCAVFAIPSLLCAFLPYSWMDATHRWLGLGTLPTEPIVGYLARSLSLLYAFVLGLLWLLARDIERHRLVLRYYGAASVVFGFLMTAVDLHEGLPPLTWALPEGASCVVLGLVVLIASYRVGRSGPA